MSSITSTRPNNDISAQVDVRGPRQHPYGLVFAVIGVIGFSSGLLLLGLAATGLALAAALLNAVFGICLGCQLYPLVARLRPKSRASTTS